MQLEKYVVMLLTDYFASQRMQNSTVCLALQGLMQPKEEMQWGIQLLHVMTFQ